MHVVIVGSVNASLGASRLAREWCSRARRGRRQPRRKDAAPGLVHEVGAGAGRREGFQRALGLSQTATCTGTVSSDSGHTGRAIVYKSVNHFPAFPLSY